MSYLIMTDIQFFVFIAAGMGIAIAIFWFGQIALKRAIEKKQLEIFVKKKQGKHGKY